MNKRKGQGIRLIVVKVDIVEFGDNEFPRIDLDPIIMHWFQLNRPR
jgi:hypothetical protein